MDSISNINTLAEIKAKADDEANDFTLTGSDLPADANPNQSDVFSQPRQKAERKAKNQKTISPKKSEPKLIGKNHRGQDLYEDGNGVRSYVDSGVLVSETVAIVPTRNGVGTAATQRAKEYEVVDEQADNSNIEGGQDNETSDNTVSKPSEVSNDGRIGGAEQAATQGSDSSEGSGQVPGREGGQRDRADGTDDGSGLSEDGGVRGSARPSSSYEINRWLSVH